MRHNHHHLEVATTTTTAPTMTTTPATTTTGVVRRCKGGQTWKPSFLRHGLTWRQTAPLKRGHVVGVQYQQPRPWWQHNLDLAYYPSTAITLQATAIELSSSGLALEVSSWYCPISEIF
jgi:hypothetical protein